MNSNHTTDCILADFQNNSFSDTLSRKIALKIAKDFGKARTRRDTTLWNINVVENYLTIACPVRWSTVLLKYRNTRRTVTVMMKSAGFY